MRKLVGILIFIGMLGTTGLSEASPAGPVPRRFEEVTVAPVTVRHGDRSLFVAEIQQALTRGGWPTADDGIFGPVTLKTVVAFQRANGLQVDGIVGAQTRKALHLGVSAADPSLAAGTPTKPAARVNPPAGDVEAIIRSVWPADLADWAVRIARRESSLVPTAANACCYGLFQIHFRAHQAWLSDYGVNQPSDLFDPTVNAIVAYALYQQTGPGPWNL